MSFSNVNNSERRLSINGRNAYVTVSVDESEPKSINKRIDDSNYLTAKPTNRASSCSPTLLSKADSTPKENKLTTKHNSMVNYSPLSLAPESMPKKSPLLLKEVTVSTNTFNPSTGAIPKTVQPTHVEKKSQVQMGIDRYITVLKRGRSPKSSKLAPMPKMSKDSLSEGINTQNRFDILQDKNDEPLSTTGSHKPPPIYLREQNSNELVKILISLIGENNFYVVPIKRGNICETKIQVNHENCYRRIVNEFETQKKNFYTYQLKSSKGQQVVIKGIDPSVDPVEVKESLVNCGFKIKNVTNIKNRERIPQPMFRVELEPGDIKLKKGESHPIYNIKFLLHRKITIEEPYKKKEPVQCLNCQEYGHTRAYCKLAPVCVVCGELHGSAECNKPKQDPNVKKCSNCGGNHTANYRGCPVYAYVKKSFTQKETNFTNPPTKVLDTQFPPIPKSNGNLFSYANVLKTNRTLNPNPKSELRNENPTFNFSRLEATIETLVQSVNNFTNSMSNMMQEMLKMQSMLLQVVLNKP